MITFLIIVLALLYLLNRFVKSTFDNMKLRSKQVHDYNKWLLDTKNKPVAIMPHSEYQPTDADLIMLASIYGVDDGTLR